MICPWIPIVYIRIPKSHCQPCKGIHISDGSLCSYLDPQTNKLPWLIAESVCVEASFIVVGNPHPGHLVACRDIYTNQLPLLLCQLLEILMQRSGKLHRRHTHHLRISCPSTSPAPASFVTGPAYRAYITDTIPSMASSLRRCLFINATPANMPATNMYLP